MEIGTQIKAASMKIGDGIHEDGIYACPEGFFVVHAGKLISRILRLKNGRFYQQIEDAIADFRDVAG